MSKPFEELTQLQLSAKLLEASKEGNEEAVKDLLRVGADPNQPIDSDGTTVLMEVSESGNFGIVKLLVEAGANVQARSEGDDTALQWAASRGWTEIVNYLLPFATKADQKIAKKTLTAKQRRIDDLVVAAGAGKVNEVRDLIDAGVNINAPGIEGYNALCAASARGQSNIVQILIDAGANLDTGGEVTYTPLLEAINQYELNVVSRLLKAGANPNQPDFGNCTTPLIAAVLRETDETWITQRLISARANINQKNRFGSTAMMAAALSNNLRNLKSSSTCSESATMRLLYENGASNKGVDEMELIAVARIGDCDKVSALVTKSLNLDLMSDDGYSALMYAAKGGHRRIVEMLINSGANIDLVGRETALICGIMGRYQEIVELLLNAGADIKLKNVYGDSPIYYAKQNKDEIYYLIKNFKKR